MKKLFIVATKIEGGKGGISSALTGYIDGLEEKGVEYKTITSHDKNILTSWLYAFMKVAYYSLKYRNQAVFWFHCGPWLSLIRKSSIALIPWLFGALTIGHIHSPTFYDYLSKSRTSQFLLKLSLLPFKHLIMLTPWWQNLLSRHNIIKPSSVSGNPNSLHFCEIAQSYISTPKPTLHKAGIINILSMARLVQGKGIDTVIEALKLLPDNYHLTVAGDGQLEKELKELSVSLNVNSRVTFLGWVDGESKERLLRDSDIFCLPSKYDSFGMVFIEAMAFDLPVIAYDWGPIADVVTSDVGVCCSNNNPLQVANAMMAVGKNLNKYSGQGPHRVLKYYTPKVVSENIVKLLK